MTEITVCEKFTDILDMLEASETQTVKLKLGDWFTFGKLILVTIRDTQVFNCAVVTEEGEQYTFNPLDVGLIVEEASAVVNYIVIEVFEIEE